MLSRRLVGCLVVIAGAACDVEATPDAPSPFDTRPALFDAPGLDAAGADATTVDGDAAGAMGLRRYDFTRGVNPGVYGSGIDRRESAVLSSRAGITALRTPLPESYLDTWGDRIEVEDWAYYETLGLDQHTVFLLQPSRAHSTAPSTAADWELAHYAPRNLDEPVFLADGSINPSNYWAVYVDRVARTYGDRIAVYEVWNEPDWVADWRVTERWGTNPPLPSELPWWNASVFAYVRALRIAHEVIRRRDPSACVTVGGLGYPSFLDAVLRYSDEPRAGTIDAAHPRAGAAYIDCLSLHFYPVFRPGGSDAGVDALLEHAEAMSGVAAARGRPGLDLTYTETGAPRQAVAGRPGGVDYAVAYLLKTMILAHHAGWLAVHWYAQGDGRNPSTESFDSMGLYYDYSTASTVGEVRRAPQGDAYAWISGLLADTAGDPTATSALALPVGARGVVFRRRDGSTRVFAWARAETSEAVTATVEIPSMSAITVRRIAASGAVSEETLSPSGDVVRVPLTALPCAFDLR